MNINILLAGFIIISVVVYATYYFTKNYFDKKIIEYNSLFEALSKCKIELEQLNSEYLALKENINIENNSLVKLNGEVEGSSATLLEIKNNLKLYAVRQEEQKVFVLNSDVVLNEKKEELIFLESLLLNAKEKKDAVVDHYNEINFKTKELQLLFGKENDMSLALTHKAEQLDLLQKQINDCSIALDENRMLYHDLVSKIDLYRRIDEFMDYGFFDIPEYLYETSDRFSIEISRVRDIQKELISSKNAITYPQSTLLFSDDMNTNKILDGQIKLMLTAFNIECDLLIGKVSPSNYVRTLDRIEKLANSLEKNAASYHCGFNIKYIENKYEECKLQYQFALKKQEEQEEQRLIREQIREEQKAIREYEASIAQTEKEEKLYRELLIQARNELNKSSNEERDAAEQRIIDLERQLKDAEFRNERAKSMAEQTRKGHVYIISNVGSFGENIYKIGLTRRLDPMDRVKELGDASVPFTFDVHAMIFVEDAPLLEASLHREFSMHRVNAVNLRKEFFRVDLDSIKKAVEKIAGIDAQFKMTILAEEYYESRRLQAPLEVAY